MKEAFVHFHKVFHADTKKKNPDEEDDNGVLSAAVDGGLKFAKNVFTVGGAN